MVDAPGGLSVVQSAEVITGPNVMLRSAVVMTVPPKQVLFQISEDRLALLCAHQNDASLEMAVGFFGGALGLIQNVVYVVRDMGKGQIPSGVDLTLAFICVGCLVYALARYNEHKKNATRIGDLEQKIREGTEVPLP